MYVLSIYFLLIFFFYCHVSFFKYILYMYFRQHYHCSTAMSVLFCVNKDIINLSSCSCCVYNGIVQLWEWPVFRFTISLCIRVRQFVIFAVVRLWLLNTDTRLLCYGALHTVKSTIYCTRTCDIIPVLVICIISRSIYV